MATEYTLDKLLEAIGSEDPATRTTAWQHAGQVGPPALKLLAALAAKSAAHVKATGNQAAKKNETAQALEVGRAAKRAMWQIVHTAAGPKGGAQRAAAETELVALLQASGDDAFTRDILWMLSAVGGDRAVAAFREIPDVLANEAIRDDVRCAVERIPTAAAVQALEDGLEPAPHEFQLAIAHSLRVRGVEVDRQKYPDRKLVPVKSTKVRPVGR